MNDNMLIHMWECGNLTELQEIELFQRLVDTGRVWHLPIEYRNQAERFIRSGLVEENSE